MPRKMCESWRARPGYLIRHRSNNLFALEAAVLILADSRPFGVMLGLDPIGAKISVRVPCTVIPGLDPIGANLSSCHDRAWPGYPRLAVRQAVKSWVAGPGPAMTKDGGTRHFRP